MGELLEQTFNRIKSDLKYKDPEFLKYTRQAHEIQQDIAGLTLDQSEWLDKFDLGQKGKSIVSAFDREQSQVLLLTSPIQEVE